jgi:hypothetical protein
VPTGASQSSVRCSTSPLSRSATRCGPRVAL